MESGSGVIIDLKSTFFLGFFPSDDHEISQIGYLLIECTDFSQTSASRSREAMEFHNWGHNSQSEKYSRSYDHFTFLASNPTLKSKLFSSDFKSFFLGQQAPKFLKKKN
jgi:hypothetical protein